MQFLTRVYHLSSNYSVAKDKNFVSRWSKTVQIRLENDQRAQRQGVQTLPQLISFVETPLGNQTQALRPYLKWVFWRYATQGIVRFEDINSRAIPALKKFARLKAKKVFQQQGIEVNLEKYKSLGDLEGLVEKFEKQVQPANQQLENELIKNNEVRILYNDVNYKIVSPRTEKASCYYGRNTRWCTTGYDNDFEDYNDRGPLYIFLDKRKNRRWQLHWDHARLRRWSYHDDDEDPDEDPDEEAFSFMDEKDRPVKFQDLSGFLRQYPVLPRVFNKPKFFPIFRPKTKQQLEQLVRDYPWSIKLFKRLPRQLQMDLFDYGRKLARNPHEDVEQRMLDRGVSKHRINELKDNPEPMSLEQQLEYLQTGIDPRNEEGRGPRRFRGGYRRRPPQKYGHLIKEIENPSLEAQLFAVNQDTKNYQYIKNPHIRAGAVLLKKYGKSIRDGKPVPKYFPMSLIRLLVKGSKGPISLTYLFYFPQREQRQMLPRFVAWLETKNKNKTLSFMRDASYNLGDLRRFTKTKFYDPDESIITTLLKWLIRRGKAIDKAVYRELFKNLTPEQTELLDALKSRKAITTYREQHPNMELL